MATTRAELVLPASLINEIQKYIQGQEIYIPKAAENYARWGERSGIRADLNRRNCEIQALYLEGAGIEDLMARFHLGYDSIRKIVRDQRRKNVSEVN